MSTATQTPKNTKESSSQRKENPTKKYLIIGFLSIMVYGFVLSIYNFRIAAAKENIPVRAMSDLWYILLASLLNLVRFL